MTAAEEAHRDLMLSLLVERHCGMPRWNLTPAPDIAPFTVVAVYSDDPDEGQRRLNALVRADRQSTRPPGYLKAVS